MNHSVLGTPHGPCFILHTIEVVDPVRDLEEAGNLGSTVRFTISHTYNVL